MDCVSGYNGPYGVPREKSQDVTCDPITVERMVLSSRPQQADWGAPCVPLATGDTFSITNRGSRPFEVTIQQF